MMLSHEDIYRIEFKTPESHRGIEIREVSLKLDFYNLQSGNEYRCAPPTFTSSK